MKENEKKEFEEKSKSFSKMVDGIFSSWKQEKKDARAYFYVAVEYEKKEGEIVPLFVSNSTSGKKFPLLASMSIMIEQNPQMLESIALPVFYFFTKYFEDKDFAKDYDFTNPTKSALFRFFGKLNVEKVSQLMEGLNVDDDDR